MDDLRYYLATCALPPMQIARNAPLPPPQGHKSHQNYLQVRPELWRRLERIAPLNVALTESAITSWIDNNIPREPLDASEVDITEERLTIPCPSVVSVSLEMMKKPDGVPRMVPWLDSLPLQTIQSTIHITYPQLLDWGFHLINDAQDRDRDICQYFCWSQDDPETLDPDSSNTLTVAFQPPWILSDQDIKEFSDCRSFPPFRKAGNAYPTTLESQHRVWAKVWDICVQRKTRWFVLTSYHNWVFGGFSEGWSTGFVTDVYAYDSYNPSIAECLTFWVASSMGIAGSAGVPTVPEPLGHHLIPVSVPLHRIDGLVTPADSESNWDGKNDEVGSSAGVWSNLSGTDSFESGLPGPVRPLNHTRLLLREPLMTNWLATTLSSMAPDAPAIIPVGSTKPERVEALGPLGDWLV